MSSFSKRRKIERTNYAVSAEHADSIDAATTIESVINEYILTKKAERAAPRTISEYENHLRYLTLWLHNHHPNLPFSRLSAKVIHEYISYLTNEKAPFDDHPRRSKPGVVGLSPGTVNIRIRSLKAFFNWCHRNGHIYADIGPALKQQRVDQDRIVAFTYEQVKTLLDIPDRSTYPGFRDYVVMMTLLDTGLRISELCSLRTQDVDFESLGLTVPWEKAKTRKTRVVPISKIVARLIAELIRENEDFGPQFDHIFYSAYGNVLTLETFDERLRQYGRQAGITGVRVSAHTFRHTFAVHWIKNGGDPFSLQKILGHTDMAMVRRYVRLSDSDVKAKHHQFSPVHSLTRK